MTYVLWTLAILCIGLGILGSILPALPGVPLVFVGFVLAAWADSFEKVGALPLLILGALTVLSLILDHLLTAWGAKKAGASRPAMIGAVVGAVVGMIGTLAGAFLTLPALILGPFIGAAIGEYYHERNLEQAGKSGVGAVFGVVFGIAVRMALISAMIALFIIAYIF